MNNDPNRLTVRRLTDFSAVTPDGAVVRIGSFVDTDDYTVRPAMWVKT